MFGNFKDLKLVGLAEYRTKNMQISGTFENFMCNSHGQIKFQDSSLYPSQKVNEKVYIGEIRGNQPNGKGILTDHTGKKHIGIYKNGKLVEEIVEEEFTYEDPVFN